MAVDLQSPGVGVTGRQMAEEGASNVQRTSLQISGAPSLPPFSFEIDGNNNYNDNKAWVKMTVGLSSLLLSLIFCTFSHRYIDALCFLCALFSHGSTLIRL
jgi:hypothetical protein